MAWRALRALALVLRGLGDRSTFETSSRNGEAVFIRASCLDAESVCLQRRLQVLVCCRLLRIDPDDQDCCRIEIIYKPIERRLERLQRALAPIDKSHPVLFGWMSAISRGRSAEITAGFQRKHELYGFRARDYDAILRRATSESDHRSDDAFVCGSGMQLGHDIHHLVNTILRTLARSTVAPK